MAVAPSVSARRILVLRALGLGDFLAGLPAYRAVARAFPRPEHRILLAAPEALAPLLRWVDAIDDLVPSRPLAPVRGAQRPDVAVNLHGRGPQSHRVLLETRPRRLIAFRHPDVPESAHGPEFRENEHEVQRWCRLLEESGIPADPEELDLPVVGVSPVASGHVVLHPGAASPARRWPAKRFGAVASGLVDLGYRVVVTGGMDERSLAREVVAVADRVEVSSWAGRLDLGRLATLVRHAELVVCGDTGIAHLATAVRTPSVVLYGPVPPALWGPPLSRPIHRAIHRGGSGDSHGPEVDPRLLAIGVDEVLEVAEALLAARSPRDGPAGEGSRR